MISSVLSFVHSYEQASASRERACRDLMHFYAFATRMLIGAARLRAYCALCNDAHRS
jgi:hypothetical protein